MSNRDNECGPTHSIDGGNHAQASTEQNFGDYLQSFADREGCDLSTLLVKIRSWYNGFAFSRRGETVYNPFSLLLLLDGQDFRNYWFESGTPTFLIQLIQNQHYDIRQLDDLNVGELAFSSYDIERLQVLPLLYQTGYLTIKGYDPERQLYRLGYPNREIVASAAQPGLHGPRTVGKQRHHEITICVEDDMHTQLTRHLHKLSVEIGCRPVGSPANQAAAAYVRDVFSALGLVVEEQTYACTGWQCAGAWLSAGGDALPVEANAFSPACDVTATVVPAATLTELAAADLTDRIALLHGELVNEPLAPKSWFLAGERDHAIIGLLESKRPAAVLAPPPPTPQYEQFTADWELEIPAATTPVAVIERLLAQPALLHLRLDCAKYPATAANIVARKPGARPPGAPPQRMALMAHFDTRFNTPGALDNAGSAAALLALAETLRGAVLPFDLEFIAFDSEEYLPIGDDEYVRRAGEASFAEVALAINMDGAGYVHGPNTVARFNTSPALTARLEAIVARYPALQWTEPWPQSNHSTFSFRGVPALAFSSQGAFNLAHFPTDTMDKVSVEKLAEVVALVREIVAS